ncbi:hypothetical protein V2E24_01120 [Mycoplasmopsis ciconiae]|uniref:Uncharacterized protein n=1 Tax=Mycoplasmopsis ciconiae TaxID=561067 RepID=A0ABU7MLN6_9BACT|nr:hypothetical protein [Mycoplasmopsis ciconiae]
MIKIKFVSSDYSKTYIEALNLQLNVHNKDRWEKLKTNSIASFETCFFRIETSKNNYQYYILNNVFMIYVNNTITINFKNKLTLYTQTNNSSQIKDYTNIIKALKEELRYYNSLNNLNISEVEETKINSLKQKINKYEILNNFSLIKNTKETNNEN